jgi:hypothetical protein
MHVVRDPTLFCCLFELIPPVSSLRLDRLHINICDLSGICRRAEINRLWRNRAGVARTPGG